MAFDGITIAAVRKELSDALTGGRVYKIAQPEPEQIYLKDAAEQLKQILGTNVSIKQGRKKSRIEIEFYSESDLDRLIDLLLRKRQSSSPRVIDFNI